MQILTTHVTRMATGYCCVAGIVSGTHEHIRPVQGERLTTNVLAPFGGTFDMGAIIELGNARAVGRAPEIEDHLFWPDDVRRLGYVNSSRLWELLHQTAIPSLDAIFGPELQRPSDLPGRAFVPMGRGLASLGTYRPASGVRLSAQSRDGRMSIRVHLDDEGLDLALTDARYYTDHYATVDLRRYEAARRVLERGDEVILGVGLTRPFARGSDDPQRHWLQVNAVHLASRPDLRLA